MRTISRHRFLTALVLAAIIIIAASLVWAGMQTKGSMAEQTEGPLFVHAVQGLLKTAVPVPLQRRGRNYEKKEKRNS